MLWCYWLVMAPLEWCSEDLVCYERLANVFYHAVSTRKAPNGFQSSHFILYSHIEPTLHAPASTFNIITLTEKAILKTAWILSSWSYSPTQLQIINWQVLDVKFIFKHNKLESYNTNICHVIKSLSATLSNEAKFYQIQSHLIIGIFHQHTM